MMLGNVAKNLIMFVIFCMTFFFYSYYYICLVLFCLYVYGVLPWYKVDDLPKTWAVNPEHRVLLHMNMYIKYKQIIKIFGVGSRRCRMPRWCSGRLALPLCLPGAGHRPTGRSHRCGGPGPGRPEAGAPLRFPRL